MRLIFLLLFGLAVAGCDRQNGGDEQAAPPLDAAEPGKGVDRSHQGEAAPAVSFHNPDGGDISLVAMKGVPTLVNLWASWCAPCVKELPTLDRLAASHVIDGQLGVIAVSQDSGPQPSVSAFLAHLGLKHLGAFHDPEMALTSALGVQIMPTTILYDKAGKEVWRFTGDLDWTSAEAKALLAEAK